MEDLHLLKYIFMQEDNMCKLDLKDVYFCIPFAQTSKKYVGFIAQMPFTNLFVYILAWALLRGFFTKPMKVPVSLFGKIMIKQ